MTNSEYLRQHLLDRLGYRERLPSPEELRRTQWNQEFETLMRNRLLMGAFRYAPFSSQRVREYDNPDGIRRHLEEYLETGNGEHLVDIANLALVEFTKHYHPLFHFQAHDDGLHVTKNPS